MTQQHYEAHILPESIIVGNEGILKCSIPSFVADFVSIVSWVDSEGNELGNRGLNGNWRAHVWNNKFIKIHEQNLICSWIFLQCC